MFLTTSQDFWQKLNISSRNPSPTFHPTDAVLLHRQVGTTPDTGALPCSSATVFEEPYGSAKRPGLESEERRSPVPSSRIPYVCLLLTSLLLQNGPDTISGI